jgi:hypothetical protein
LRENICLQSCNSPADLDVECDMKWLRAGFSRLQEEHLLQDRVIAG